MLFSKETKYEFRFEKSPSTENTKEHSLLTVVMQHRIQNDSLMTFDTVYLWSRVNAISCGVRLTLIRTCALPLVDRRLYVCVVAGRCLRAAARRRGAVVVGEEMRR
jgi:hypothetical protein